MIAANRLKEVESISVRWPDGSTTKIDTPVATEGLIKIKQGEAL